MSERINDDHANIAAHALSSSALLFARLAIVPLYLYSSIGKVMAFSATAGRLPGGADGFGAFLAAGAIVLELGCGTALLIGLFARQAAMAVILYTVAATLMFHNFWAAPEAQVFVQTINFLKNLGLIGGLTLIVSYGAGNHSVDAALGRS